MQTMNINPNHMFSGDLFFLSNMYPCNIRMTIAGGQYVFHSAEAAFQAGKCSQPGDIRRFTFIKNGSEAKKLGRQIQMRPDWQVYRVEWMEHVCLSKFMQNEDLFQKLINTHPLPLVETNTWKDTFWGVCNGVGQNQLGKILMRIRDKRHVSSVNWDGELLLDTPSRKEFYE